MRRTLTVLLVGLVSALCLPLPASAQQSPFPESDFPAPPRFPRPRIEVHPGRLLYRRCVDWYELQHRPSGTVLYPQMRCWWVRG